MNNGLCSGSSYILFTLPYLARPICIWPLAQKCYVNWLPSEGTLLLPFLLLLLLLCYFSHCPPTFDFLVPIHFFLASRPQYSRSLSFSRPLQIAGPACQDSFVENIWKRITGRHNDKKLDNKSSELSDPPGHDLSVVAWSFHIPFF